MEIKWVRRALINLQDEAEYIALESPDAARQVVARILDQINHKTTTKWPWFLPVLRAFKGT